MSEKTKSRMSVKGMVSRAFDIVCESSPNKSTEYVLQRVCDMFEFDDVSDVAEYLALESPRR